MKESTLLTLLKIFFIGSILGISMMVIGNIAQSYELKHVQKQLIKLETKKVKQ